MTVLTVMRWLIRVWKDYISDKTIQNHFKTVLNGQNNIQTINHYPLLEGVHTGLSDWYLRSLIKKGEHRNWPVLGFCWRGCYRDLEVSIS